MARDKLDELFLADFGAFVARRNELAKKLRAEGDSEGADRVRALKKPNRVAWAINQLSARHAGLRDELLGAGAALREAQERLVAGTGEGTEVRAAGEREQAAVRRTLDAVGSLAEKDGAKLSPAAVERARQTLHAVALDESVRLDFETHRLTTEHEASGLGGFTQGAGSATPKRRGKTRSAKDDERREAKRRRDELKAAEARASKHEDKRRDAEREVEAARRAAKDAQRDLERATKALDRATTDAEAARARVDDLRGR